MTRTAGQRERVGAARVELAAPTRHVWWGASVLIAATGLALLNTTIVNVAIPVMQKELHLSPAGVSWSLAGWALGYAVPLVPAGRLGDRVGHKWVFFTGVALFTGASVGCGLAQSELQLVVFRVIQGVACGVFYPAIAASLGRLFDGRDRARAFAIMGATIGVAAAVGPLLGGFILNALPAETGWRVVFLVNIPLGLLILAGAVFFLPGSAQPASTHRGADGVGLALLTVALAGLFTPLIVGQQQGWPRWTWLCFAAGALATAVFLIWESRVDRRGGLALAPPRLFRIRGFGLPTAIIFVQFAGFLSIFYVLALLWETGLGRSPLEMGLLTLPDAIGTIVSSSVLMRVLARIGSARALVLGAILLAVGLTGLWVVVATTPAAGLTIGRLAVPLFFAGLGAGSCLALTLNAAMSAVPPDDSGSASGVFSTVQRLGNAAGLAAVGAVFFGAMDPAASPTPDRYAHASANALMLCAICGVIGVVLSLVFAARRSV